MMKTLKSGIKSKRFPLTVSLLVLCGLILASCTGVSVVNNWPGISANQEVIYLSYQGSVHAINASTGTQIWSFPKDKPDASKPFYAAPAFGPDGLIVAGTYGKTLFGFTSTGEIKWQFATKSGNFVASPLVINDSILAPASDGVLYVLSMTGTKLWEYKAQDALWTRPASDGELVFQPGLDHFLYALRLTDGSLVWKKDLESSLVSAPTLGENGTLFISTLNGDVLSINTKDGNINWQFATQGNLWSSPLVQDNTVFVGNSTREKTGKVFAISTVDGSKIWEQDAGSSIVGGGVLLPEKNLVVFSTEGGSLFAWSLTDGKAEWTQAIGGKLYSAPVIAGDNIVVAVTQGDNKILQAVTFDGQISWPFALPK